jgi:hypothetical protein
VPSLADGARITLAGIRIANGVTGLCAPEKLSNRLGAEESAGPMGYPFRMFGIRTILIGLDLLSNDPVVRRHAVRQAVIVHGSDTVSAFVTGVTGGLPRKGAIAATAISAVNTVLALVATRSRAA